MEHEWFPLKQAEQQRAIDFVLMLAGQQITRIAIENPVGVLSSRWRAPDQIIQPYQFGHAEVKTTCLWLKNLPLLRSTRIVTDRREQRCWKMPPSESRAADRARTYDGIASAMAEQWGIPEPAGLQLSMFAGPRGPAA